MQLKSRIVHFFLILLLGFVGFASLVLLELFQFEPPAATVQLPRKAEWALRADLEQLARDEAYTLLFEAQDEQFITLLRKMANERIERHNQKGRLGIDLRQDVVVFGFRMHNKRYVGGLFAIHDQQQFRQNIHRHLPKGFYAQANGQTALVLSCPDVQQIDGGHEKSMLELASDLLRDTRAWKQPAGKTPFLALETTALRGKGGSMTLNLYNDGRTIRLNGHFTATQRFETASYSLQSKGLYLHTTIIPEGMADSLSRLLPFTRGKFPELSAFVMDYQGMAISESNAGIFPVAAMNLILSSPTRFPIDSLLPKSLQGNHRFEIASMTYYLKQLDENTVFIGLDTNAIINRSSTSPFEIRGSLRSLGKIAASPNIAPFINVVPQVRFARQFIASTERVHVSMKQQQGNRYDVNGEIVFREDAYALHEVVKLLVGLGILD